MSNTQDTQEQPQTQAVAVERQGGLWQLLTGWMPESWKERKVPEIAGFVGAIGIVALAFMATFSGDNQDTAADGVTNNTDEVIEEVVVAKPDTNTGIDYNADTNTIVLPGDNATDTIEEDKIDTPAEVREIITENGLDTAFSAELTRLDSGDIDIASQATKDMGHNLANGIKVTENDALANTLFQASYDMNGNTQAAHSIGYQALHGLGMDTPDLDLAAEKLSEAQAEGHPLAEAHLDYLNDTLGYEASGETAELDTEETVADNVVDTPDEILDLIDSLGLSDVFADEVERIQSGDLDIASQATKDIGHNLANGLDTAEDDSAANQFFQASYDMNGNTQAAHSMGYQALHGLGMDGADLDLAEKMLTEANENGHSLAGDHLDYLYQIK